MAIEDFIFNERDKDRFRRFAQFSKPSGAGDRDWETEQIF